MLLDIWPIVIIDKQHLTWEYFNNLHIVNEVPFASESGPRTLNLFQKILYDRVYRTFNCIDDNFTYFVIEKDEFIKHLKYMLGKFQNY